MAYEKTTFNEGAAPGISAAEMNKIGDGIEDAHTLAESAQSNVTTHAARTDNPHNVTKTQVGLGSVQNYGIATQAQAEAGTTNTVYMTPIRTKQAIDKFTGGVPFRVNGGRLEYYDGMGWRSVGFDPTNMTLNMINVGQDREVTHISIPADGVLNVFSVNGSGVLYELTAHLSYDTNRRLRGGVEIVADGNVYRLYKEIERTVGGSPYKDTLSSYTQAERQPSADTTSVNRYAQFKTTLPIKFNSNLTIRFRNVSEELDTGLNNFSLIGGYFT